jgi:hypothetical protein
MTNRFSSGVRSDARGAVALSVILLALISLEIMYLNDFWKRGEDSRRAIDQLEVGNTQMQQHIAELRSASQKISATFTRLNDGILRVAARP